MKHYHFLPKLFFSLKFEIWSNSWVFGFISSSGSNPVLLFAFMFMDIHFGLSRTCQRHWGRAYLLVIQLSEGRSKVYCIFELLRGQTHLGIAPFAFSQLRDEWRQASPHGFAILSSLASETYWGCLISLADPHSSRLGSICCFLQRTRTFWLKICAPGVLGSRLPGCGKAYLPFSLSFHYFSLLFQIKWYQSTKIHGSLQICEREVVFPAFFSLKITFFFKKIMFFLASEMHSSASLSSLPFGTFRFDIQ